jgi:peptidoglycan/xylan/chitin deacetylase (PgdA/CDA1 family)
VAASSVAIMHDGKVHEDLVAAVRPFIAARSNLHVRIARGGPVFDRITVVVQSLGLNRHIHLPGFGAGVPNVLHVYELVVLPTHQDALGKSFIEAPGAGLPVIGTYVGSVLQMIEQDVNGLVVKDPDALPVGIEFLIEGPVVRVRLVRRGLRITKHEFAVDDTAVETIDLSARPEQTGSAGTKCRARGERVLTYDDVSTSPCMITVMPRHFSEQLDSPACASYRMSDARQFVGFFAGETLDKDAVVLTFDDNYLANWVFARPVLPQNGSPGLCFLVIGWPSKGMPRANASSGSAVTESLWMPDHHEGDVVMEGGDADNPMLCCCEIRAMPRLGKLHSRTHSHVRWDQVACNRDEMRTSLGCDSIASRAKFDARLEAVSEHLHTPRGHNDDDYLEVARAVGLRHFYTRRQGMNAGDARILPGAERSINRLDVRDRPASWLADRLWVENRRRSVVLTCASSVECMNRDKIIGLFFRLRHHLSVRFWKSSVELKPLFK